MAFICSFGAEAEVMPPLDLDLIFAADRLAHGERPRLAKVFERMADGPLLLEASVDVEQRGFVHGPPECRLISELVTMALDHSYLHEEFTRLIAALLAEPSCTREIVMEFDFLNFLTRAPGVCWLPLALAILRKHDPPPWTSWLHTSCFYADSLEFQLRFLLAPGVLAVRPGPVTPYPDEQREKDGISSCAPSRLIAELMPKLVAFAEEHHSAATPETLAAPTEALRDWIQQQLDTLPVTFLSIFHLERIRAAKRDNPSVALAALIDDLTHRPHLVHLDECDQRRNSLLAIILELNESQLRQLEPAIPALIERIVATHERAPDAANHAIFHFRGLLDCAVADGPLGPFDQLLGALIDVSVRSSSTPDRWQWTHSLSVIAGDRGRIVQRSLDLLAMRGGGIESYDLEFVRQLVRFQDYTTIRKWIHSHGGSDRATAIELLLRVLHISSSDSHHQLTADKVQIFDKQVQEWADQHWPAIRSDVEMHLRPDLAEMVLVYLHLTPPTLSPDPARPEE